MSAEQFFADYMMAIDVIAVLALVLLAGVAFMQRRSIWMLVLGLAVIVWSAARFFNLI